MSLRLAALRCKLNYACQRLEAERFGDESTRGGCEWTTSDSLHSSHVAWQLSAHVQRSVHRGLWINYSCHSNGEMAHEESAKGRRGVCAGEEQPHWADRLTSKPLSPLWCAFDSGKRIRLMRSYNTENMTLYFAFCMFSIPSIMDPYVANRKWSGTEIWLTWSSNASIITSAPPESQQSLAFPFISLICIIYEINIYTIIYSTHFVYRLSTQCYVWIFLKGWCSILW